MSIRVLPARARFPAAAPRVPAAPKVAVLTQTARSRGQVAGRSQQGARSPPKHARHQRPHGDHGGHRPSAASHRPPARLPGQPGSLLPPAAGSCPGQGPPSTRRTLPAPRRGQPPSAATIAAILGVPARNGLRPAQPDVAAMRLNASSEGEPLPGGGASAGNRTGVRRRAGRAGRAASSDRGTSGPKCRLRSASRTSLTSHLPVGAGCPRARETAVTLLPASARASWPPVMSGRASGRTLRRVIIHGCSALRSNRARSLGRSWRPPEARQRFCVSLRGEGRGRRSR